MVRNLYDENGLLIIEPIHFGSWSGRGEFVDVQDIIIATKPNSK